jgi:type VI secretion system protein ImpG
MSDELLAYYNRELGFIRKLGVQFAKDHPKIAGRLRLGPDALSEDPHVERLIEAFAYLTARVRNKIEDEFPEITESLLSILYPHYQAPIPSMAIVEFGLDPEQTELTTGTEVPRGTMIETEPIQGEPCRFRSCYPVTLWPIEVRQATISRPPFQAPRTPHAADAASVLRLTLACRSPAMRFSALDLGTLRFYFKGQPQFIYKLYDTIFNHVIEVALAAAPDDRAPLVSGPGCLRPVGFERDEGLLPYTPRSFLGYRLLTEYFTFPDKFLFFDIADLSAKAMATIGNQLEVFLYLNRTDPDLEQNVSGDTFRLGCTPMVNLFSQRAEPIQLTNTDYEYRVVPDARRPLANEVYSIDKVVAVSPDDKEVEYLPFYSVQHAVADDAPHTYWHSARRPAEASEGPIDHGTEVFLALVDLGMRPTAPANWTLGVETTCLNRDLPPRLPFGGDQPHLQLSEGQALVTHISCLTPPTRTLRPALKEGTLWRLISHLSLNHLSIVDNDDKATALREILKLYDFTDSPQTRKIIDGIIQISSQRVVGRVRGAGAVAFCRGVEVTIRFDEDRFTGSSLLLFAAVLERFLAMYCTVNSFSKLIATTKGREGELHRWPPRMGEKVLA